MKAKHTQEALSSVCNVAKNNSEPEKKGHAGVENQNIFLPSSFPF